ncbi:DUF6443 domain-containing protein [Flavivirga sp. 57AJ16]|uniref:DUF6443 domain-containing protein n=1 Tax=Flavivirga sp. 57AJ16 TaxID=3025307 RepID=UPI002366465F|nr:DUF6443 domain-containing protein [Flavivirga sp. 57AJ16]MDD7884635.1 DUF6443 domain-containing protein [Flavivirga sp. 57AJ16]
MRHYIYTFLFLLVSQAALSQTPATIVKDGSYTVDSSSGTVTLTATQSITLKPDTWIKSGSTFLAQIVEPTTALDDYTPFSFSNENYVFTRSFQVPMATFNAVTAKEGDVVESITYFDGLGRPMQGIGIKAAPDKKDIITHIDYDAYGRQDKDWLPYHETSGTLGTYRGDRATATKQYYMDNYADDFTGVTLPDINAYSQKGFEASPLSRTLQQGAPGKDWRLGGNNEIEFVYGANATNEVRLYQVTLTPLGSNGLLVYKPTLTGGSTYYGEGELYKTITKDENHDGTTSKNRTTEEFKDKQGRVVLKRTYADIGGVSTAHDTYYVYDDYGNLSFVIPPKVDTSDGVSLFEFLELCYQYRYDHRNRLVEKKIPGKDMEYIVYDNLDRPVMTQDANLKAQNQWLFTKYDIFGRVVYTGLHTNTVQTTRADMQTHFNTVNNLDTELYESKVTSGTGYDNSYYTNANFPDSNIELHTVNYYDDYSFDKDGLSLPDNADGQTVINYNDANKVLTNGLATGSKVRVLTTNDWITSLTGYDVKGRPVYVASKNNYLSTTDVVTSKLDFVGKVDRSTATHTKTGQNAITIQDDFVHDHEGRLLRQKQAINDLDQETIVDNSYDDLGQLEAKGVGGRSSNANRLQEVNYTYNVRGWLRGINNTGGSNTAIALGANDLFGFQINYNASDTGGTALFNGNISQTLWKSTSVNTTGNPVANKYSYGYDALNRITAATGNTSNYDLSSIAYDKNGNITNLVRRGHTNSGATTFGVMDDLTYSYNAGNKLMKVTDAAPLDQFGFKDDAVNTATDSVDDYTYNANGNMLTDANKGISTDIIYNHLNLPTQVVLGGGNISYIYDALGIKLSKIVSQQTSSTSSSKQTFYAGSYVYEITQSCTGLDTDNVQCYVPLGEGLKFINHPEGYLEPKNQFDLSQGFNYIYQYKDHLGNVRLSYSDTDGNGQISASTEILEENHYYPFGLEHKGYNANVASTNPAQKYKYNGKEFQDELGLNMYDYGARFYEPATGRWFTPDAMAEKYYDQSIYVYTLNNPIIFVDPDGNQVAMCCDGLVDFAKGLGDVALGLASANHISQAYSQVRTGIDMYNNPDQATEIALNSTGIPGMIETAKGAASGDARSLGQVTGVVLTAVLTKKLGSRSIKTSSSSSQKLYRGVNSESPAYNNATKGTAKPRGGDATAAEHNAGNTSSNYTSWTTNKEVAKNFALRKNGNGVVLEANVPKSSTVSSPSVKSVNLKQSPGTIVNEAEVLVKGTVKKAKTTHVNQ